MYNKRSPHPILWMMLLLITLFLILSYTIASAGTSDLSLSARAAVLYEPETKSFLYEKNCDLRLPMASTTKVMTALVAIERGDLGEYVEIDSRAVGTEGSSAYLKEGEIITLEELLYALLLSSANDAAVAIACHISGEVDKFATLMNEKAVILGLKNTSFKNPHGLDDTEHYTTAKDLAIISAEAMKNETFKNIVSSYKKSFSSEERSRTYVNHNKLLNKYDGCVGVKTGFTKKSGRCLVGACEKDGVSLITVTLNASDDWCDHEKLFDLGYSMVERIILCNPYDYLYTVPTIGAKDKSVTLTNKDGFSAIVPKGVHIIKDYVKSHRYLIAPVSDEEILGEIYFTVDGKKIGSVRLYSTDNITNNEEKGLLKRIFDIWKR